MSNYLVHREHKYIKKFGNRYFYTTEELKAFYDKAKGGKNELKPNQIQLDKRTTGTFGEVALGKNAKAPEYEHPTGYKLRKKIDDKVASSKAAVKEKLRDPLAKEGKKYDKRAHEAYERSRTYLSKSANAYNEANYANAVATGARAATASNADELTKKAKIAEAKSRKAQVEYENASSELHNLRMKARDSREHALLRKTTFEDDFYSDHGKDAKQRKMKTISDADDRLIKYNTEDRYTKVDANRAAASKKAEEERKQKRGANKARGTFVGGPTTDSAYKVNRIEESKKKGAAYDNKVSSAKKKTSDFIKTQREIGNEEAKDAIFKKEKRKKR